MQEEITQKTLALCVEASKMTAQLLQQAIYTCCACSSSNNRIDSNVCSCYNWNERLKKALECS